jgi:hypothetical protein
MSSVAENIRGWHNDLQGIERCPEDIILKQEPQIAHGVVLQDAGQNECITNSL